MNKCKQCKKETKNKKLCFNCQIENAKIKTKEWQNSKVTRLKELDNIKRA